MSITMDAFTRQGESHMQSRLTRATSEEFHILRDCLQLLLVRQQEDQRYMTSTDGSAFSSRLAYIGLHASDIPLPETARIWSSRVPTKVKFFGWLLHFGRLSTRANLHRKNIRPAEESFL
jgi:hypothetical protein